ncbi:hypothetical protein TNCV_2055231 [Trichonephila clavipes]|uniref:Uncharacterized protein n=1 Tax=Trichonephila clavipes TaxID=2585209 RepID=A0A8X6UXD5_TRICX|nr:hypothetical protein TNCV_2055231 [Trichonephila clavipes]
MTKTRALSALISSERVLSTRVFFKSGESTSKSSYAGGGFRCTEFCADKYPAEPFLSTYGEKAEETHPTEAKEEARHDIVCVIHRSDEERSY